MTVYAFTELHNDYPAFVNLSEHDGALKLSVRTRSNSGKEYATIVLTDTQAEELAEAIFKHVYAADAPSAPATLPAAPAPSEQAGELPPLPEPFGRIDIYEDSGRVRSVDGFDATQMRGYAIDYANQLGRAALAAQQAPTAAPKDKQQVLTEAYARLTTGAIGTAEFFDIAYAAGQAADSRDTAQVGGCPRCAGRQVAMTDEEAAVWARERGLNVPKEWESVAQEKAQ